MRKLLFILPLCVSLFAQTADFPSRVASDATMFKAANSVLTRLVAAQSASATVAVVDDPTGITPNMLISVGTTKPEIEAVCAVAGSVLTIGYNGSCPSITGRGFDGTAAVAHTSGSPVGVQNVAWHTNKARL